MVVGNSVLCFTGSVDKGAHCADKFSSKFIICSLISDGGGSGAGADNFGDDCCAAMYTRSQCVYSTNWWQCKYLPVEMEVTIPCLAI